MRKVFRLIFTKLALKNVSSFEGPVYVNGFSWFSKKTFLAKNCHFNGMRIKGGGNVFIGNNFHSGSGCKIITTYHDYDNDDYIPYGSKVIHKDVHIGDNVWLGEDVLILGGVSIADGAIIQAGSVVVSDVGYCGIAGGAPAKTFKQRNIEHYEKLCRLGKFR